MLAYTEMGEGTPLIVLHGLFGTGDNWISLARHWSQFFRVILPDARNHGHSFRSETFDYPSMSQDLAELVEHLQLTHFHLVGHSMGAKTSMFYALSHPEKLLSLTLVDMSIFENKLDHQKVYLNALAQLPLEEMHSRSEVDQALALQISDFGIRQFLLKSLTRDDEKNFSWRLNIPVFLKTVDQIGVGIPPEGTFSGPTLFIKGGKSDYIKDTDWPIIKHRFPRATLETIPEAGHWVHADAPQAFSQILIPFLQKNTF